MNLGHGATVPKLVTEGPKQELEPSNRKLPTVDYLAVDMLLNQRIVTSNPANVRISYRFLKFLLMKFYL